MGFEISSKEELFFRVRPALKIKVNELKNLGFSFVMDYDVWNYLVQVKWVKSKDLMLCDVVHDIFNVDNNNIIQYSKERIKDLNNNNLV